MDKDELNQLHTLLTKFFSTFDINKKDFVRRSPVATLLKKELTKKKRWKRLNRGRLINDRRPSELKAQLLRSLRGK